MNDDTSLRSRDPAGDGDAARPLAAADSSTEPTAETCGSLSGQSLTFGLSQAGRAGHDPLLGVDLGGICIERLIAEGGMGRVYLARQQRPARPVAVKFMRHGRNAASLERFRQEAEVLGRLSHPGIARVFSAGSLQIGLDDVPYSVMEYIPEAEPLVGFCQSRLVSLEGRLRLFLQVCEAVAYGHAQGVVHRDLKPGNILVTPEGAGAEGRACVIDYGIAKLLAADSDDSVTSTGEFLGTRRYMSPEQFAGEKARIDARTDVYALGVILHELLTGKLPYDIAGRSITETARIVAQVRPQPLEVSETAVPSQLRSGLKRIAERCLRKRPEERYRSATALAADVRGLLRGIAIEPSHRSRLPPWLSAFGLLAIVSIGFGGWWRLLPPAPSAATGPSAVATARTLGGRFGAIQADRSMPVSWINFTFTQSVENVDLASLSLTRDGVPVNISHCKLTRTEPVGWRLDGLTSCNETAGHYVLTINAGENAPVDISGNALGTPISTEWTLPPFQAWRLSVLDDAWKNYVVSIDGLEAYTETDAGSERFLRPTQPGVEGTLVLRFETDFEIAAAQLWAATHIWTTGDPFPYDPGARSSVEVSPDGMTWTLLDKREAGKGGTFYALSDLTTIVEGSRQVWIRVRLTATVEWPGDGLIHAQFMRSNAQMIAEQNAPFILHVAAAPAEETHSAPEEVDRPAGKEAANKDGREPGGDHDPPHDELVLRVSDLWHNEKRHHGAVEKPDTDQDQADQRVGVHGTVALQDRRDGMPF